MARIISPESAEGKELLKYEQWPANWNGTRYEAGNPYTFRAYPKMLYRAFVKENGKVVCLEPAPEPDRYEKPTDYDRAIRLNDALNKACSRIVESESAEQLAKGQGWCDTPTRALEVYEQHQQAIGNAAAERAFTDKRMTMRAQEEAAAADAATHAHVGDVPRTPLKPRRKPGRKPKAKPVEMPESGG